MLTDKTNFYPVIFSLTSKILQGISVTTTFSDIRSHELGARYIFIYLVFSTGHTLSARLSLKNHGDISTRSIEKIIKKKSYYFDNLAQYQRGYDYKSINIINEATVL